MEQTFRSATIKKLLPSFNEDYIIKIKNTFFNPLTSDEGFLFLETKESNFMFRYLRKLPLTYGEYEGNYVIKTRSIIKDTTFQIDLKNRIMIIFSGKNESNFLIRRFIRNFGILTSDLNLNLSEILSNFTSSKFITKSEQAIITGFVYKELMVGTYIVDINDIEILKEILSKYGDKVKRIKLSIEHYDGDVSKISIDKNGSFIFNNFSEKNKELLNFIIFEVLSKEE